MSLFKPLIDIHGNLFDADLQESYVYFGLSHDAHCYPKGKSRVIDIGITDPGPESTRLLNGKDSQLRRVPTDLFPVRYVLAYTDSTLKFVTEPDTVGLLGVKDIELTLQYVFLAITGGMPLVNLVKAGGNARLDLAATKALLTAPFLTQLCLFADDAVSQRTAYLCQWLDQIATDTTNPVSLKSHPSGACVHLNVQPTSRGFLQINPRQPLVGQYLIQKSNNNMVKATVEQAKLLADLDLWLR